VRLVVVDELGVLVHIPPKRMERYILEQELRVRLAAGRPNISAATSRVALSSRTRKVTTVSYCQCHRSPSPCQDRGGSDGQSVRSGGYNGNGYVA
jgi:hypothetical protein